MKGTVSTLSVTFFVYPDVISTSTQSVKLPRLILLLPHLIVKYVHIIIIILTVKWDSNFVSSSFGVGTGHSVESRTDE